MGGGWKVGAARIRTERGQERLDSHVACKRYLLILRDEMIDRRCELSVLRNAWQVENSLGLIDPFERMIFALRKLISLRGKGILCVRSVRVI